MTNEPDDDLLRAWLLHRLTDERAIDALEQRVLTDDAFDMRLRAIETDLLDDYARQRLNDEDRQAVARWLLATAPDRLRLRTARALGKLLQSQRQSEAAGSSPPQERPAIAALQPMRPRRRRVFAFGFALAAALLLAVLGYEQRGRLLQAPIDSLAANAPTITLLANLQRGVADEPRDGPSAVINFPRAAPTLRLQVEVAGGDDSTRYTLQVMQAARSVFESPALVARTNGPYRFVEVALASALLDDGDYTVRLAANGAAQPPQEWALRTRRH